MVIYVVFNNTVATVLYFDEKKEVYPPAVILLFINTYAEKNGERKKAFISYFHICSIREKWRKGKSLIYFTTQK